MYVHDLDMFKGLHIGEAKMNEHLLLAIIRQDNYMMRKMLYQKSRYRPHHPQSGLRHPNNPNRKNAEKVVWLLDLNNSHLIQKNNNLLRKGYTPERWGVAEVLMHLIFYFDYYQTPARLEIPYNLQNFGQFHRKGELTSIDINNDNYYGKMRKALGDAYVNTFRKQQVKSFDVNMQKATDGLAEYINIHGSFVFQVFNVAINSNKYNMV